MKSLSTQYKRDHPEGVVSEQSFELRVHMAQDARYLADERRRGIYGGGSLLIPPASPVLVNVEENPKYEPRSI